MLNAEQIKYLNGVALQHLMNLNPDYDESHKREIYRQTIDSLSIHIMEEYWRLKHQGEGN
jgi:hypothetical protein